MPEVNFLICDVAKAHVLTKTDMWRPFPIHEDDFEDFVSFETRKEAEQYAIARTAEGCHCRPYAV